MENVTQYFKDNPSASQVFVTHDGFLFDNKRMAQAHANTLEKKEVQAFSNTNLSVDVTPAQAYLETRPEQKGVWITANKELFTCEKMAKAIDPNAVYVVIDQKKEDTTSQEESNTAILKVLENTELVKGNYTVLKKLVTELKLEVKDQKAATLIRALTEFKATLKPI